MRYLNSISRKHGLGSLCFLNASQPDKSGGPEIVYMSFAVLQGSQYNQLARDIGFSKGSLEKRGEERRKEQHVILRLLFRSLRKRRCIEEDREDPGTRYLYSIPRTDARVIAIYVDVLDRALHPKS